MHRLSIRTFNFKSKSHLLRRVSSIRRRLRSAWAHFIACWMCNSSVRYQFLSPISVVPPPSETPFTSAETTPLPSHDLLDAPDLVSVKIALLGDSHIGKTSFLRTYAGEEEIAVTGANQVDKTLSVQGATISYNICVVGGDVESSNGRIPPACKDAMALLFMFDLSSRRTLNSVIGWYQDARKWNPTAIVVLIGTKFDEFVQLPIDLQWTIASQARSYAKAMNATLFFSSATYNINVNKIFKFITAKLFDLQWNLERNLTIGEPIIDF